MTSQRNGITINNLEKKSNLAGRKQQFFRAVPRLELQMMLMIRTLRRK